MKIVVIGGVAAGMSTAARARRLNEKAEIIVLERSGHVSFANCGLPYYIGGEIKTRSALLLQTPESLRNFLNIDVRIKHEAISIDSKNKKISVLNLETKEEYEETYDKLVLAPGAIPLVPPIQGVNSKKVFVLRNIEDSDSIFDFITKNSPNRALVVGGGYIGIEMAENLALRGLKVELVEIFNQILPPFDPEMTKELESHLQDNGVSLHLGTAAMAFKETENGLSVELQNSKILNVDMAILCAGVKADSKLAKIAGITLNQRGAIKVDEFMQTSVPDIYAGGDVVEVIDAVSGKETQIPLAGPANRQGRIIADNIFGRKSKYTGTLGTAILKVFKMCAACVGNSEKTLKQNSISYKKIYLYPTDHAGYYPDAKPLHIKILFNDEGKILGAQIIGYEGVDKRIDVLATAIKAGMTVYDLESVELAYAPPYGAAKDPINMAGFIASNLLRGDLECWYPEDYPEKTKNGVIIDVRPADLFELQHIPGAINIPLGLLRSKMIEIPRNKDIFLYCKVGLISYLAYRILKQSGFGENNSVKGLTGGLHSFKCFHKIDSSQPEETSPFIPYAQEASAKSASPKSANFAKDTPEKFLDLSGLQCPGPIMKIKDSINEMRPGEIIVVKASDPGFPADLRAWCAKNGHSLAPSALPCEFRISKGVSSPSQTPEKQSKGVTIVVFSGDLDKVLAAFVIANGALAMGDTATLFFTFWGINALRKNAPQASDKSLIDKMFGMMMPKGPGKLKLSKMNMLGLGTEMMKNVMKGKNVASLPELIDTAKKGGAKLVVCSMSMDVMGLKREELIDGIEIGGVASFLGEAYKSGTALFI